MADPQSKVETDRQRIVEARQRGLLPTLGVYTRLSGPGWLQSAITLGGGSLASSLYLGVLAGFSLLWLQPLAMLFGIIMLSAIGYVAMSVDERPFRAINRHVNPVLGWGWALASLLANMVWALPQYSLATGVLQQNLLPDTLGGDHADTSRWFIVGAILVVTTAITWSYDSGGWGVRLYELLLKVLVGLVVICFFGVVVKLALADGGGLDWGGILGGYVPDFGAVFRPARTLEPLLAQVGDEGWRQYWSGVIVAEQRDVIISAAATAVGINMTFLFPYSLIRRGWRREFRGLVKFDLATGMLVPFLLATSCVVIASATQFHLGIAKDREATVAEVENDPSTSKAYHKILRQRVLAEADPQTTSPADADTDRGRKVLRSEVLAAIDPDEDAALAVLRDEVLEDTPEAEGDAEWTGDLVKQAIAARIDREADRRAGELSAGEQRIAAGVVRRDAKHLATSLAPLTSDFFANVIFGLGVLAMALSTITILMLISGFVVCEIFDLPQGGWYHRLGCLAAGTGVLGPFLWSGDAEFWLAVPTSVFGFMLIPIAYLTFLLLMNQRSLLGEEMPRGGRRLAWNVCMTVATAVAGTAAIYMVWVKAGKYGLAAAGLFVGLALVVHFVRKGPGGSSAPPAS